VNSGWREVRGLLFPSFPPLKNLVRPTDGFSTRRFVSVVMWRSLWKRLEMKGFLYEKSGVRLTTWSRWVNRLVLFFPTAPLPRWDAFPVPLRPPPRDPRLPCLPRRPRQPRQPRGPGRTSRPPTAQSPTDLCLPVLDCARENRRPQKNPSRLPGPVSIKRWEKYIKKR